MAASYEIRIYTVAGVLQTRITDMLSLGYVKRVNEPGYVSFTLKRDHAAIAYLVDKAQVEVWRCNPAYSLDWYCDFYGLMRKQEVKGAPANTFTATCLGQLHILDWRIVAWNKGYPNRSIFTSTPAETIMKTLVTYNATTSATVANGRITDGTWGDRTMSVQTDAAGGTSRDWEASNQSLLGTLKDLSRVAGGDFDLVKTAASTWQFRFYAGQRGTDRTATVIISEERGNMTDAVFVDDRTGEKSHAVIGGNGDDLNRLYTTANGTNYNSTTNDIEMFVNASNYTTTAGWTATGAGALFQALPKRTFAFRVLEVPSTVYGVHYTLGDLVTVVFDGTSYTQKVAGLTVSWKASTSETPQELIVPEMVNVS